MANTNIQIIPHSTDALRIYLLHVRVACPREGHPSRPCPVEVGTATHSSLHLISNVDVIQFTGGRELRLFPNLHDRKYGWCCISLSLTFYTCRYAFPLRVRSCQADLDEEQIIEIVYSLLWAIVVFGPLQQRLYESVILGARFSKS
jgi:hypothetical protein